MRRSSLEEWATENKLLAPYGRTQMGVLVEETLKGARLLAATPGIDPNRIGLTGMSLGGNATWYAMACAPWIWAGVPVCGGVGSMARVIHHTVPPTATAPITLSPIYCAISTTPQSSRPVCLRVPL